MPRLDADFDVPVDAITALLQALVRTPSRAGEDAMAPVLAVAARWFQTHALPLERLTGDDGRPLGLYAEVQGGSAGPWIVLNATLDTAGFGDPGTWARPPTGGDVADGCLFGRGSADSKAGAALFAHLLAHFHTRREGL